MESDLSPEIVSTENVNKNSEVFSISTEEKGEVISTKENNSNNSDESCSYSKINIENISVPLVISSSQLDHPQVYVTNETNKQPIVTDGSKNIKSPNQSILTSPNQSILMSPNQSLIDVTGFNHFETPEKMTEDMNIHNKESVICNKTLELNIEQDRKSVV